MDSAPWVPSACPKFHEVLGEEGSNELDSAEDISLATAPETVHAFENIDGRVLSKEVLSFGTFGGLPFEGRGVNNGTSAKRLSTL